MSYLRYLCLFAHSGFQHIFTIRVTWRMSCGRQKLFAIRVPFGGVRVAHLFWFSVLFFLICLSVSCVPNVASYSELSIRGCPFGFL